MRLNDLADRIEETGTALAGTSTTIAEVDPGNHAFGGDAPGALGDVGRALHRQVAAALAARAREAAAHGARLADAADQVRRAAADYDAVDRAVRRHIEGESD